MSRFTLDTTPEGRIQAPGAIEQIRELARGEVSHTQESVVRAANELRELRELVDSSEKRLEALKGELKQLEAGINSGDERFEAWGAYLEDVEDHIGYVYEPVEYSEADAENMRSLYSEIRSAGTPEAMLNKCAEVYSRVGESALDRYAETALSMSIVSPGDTQYEDLHSHYKSQVREMFVEVPGERFGDSQVSRDTVLDFMAKLATLDGASQSARPVTPLGFMRQLGRDVTLLRDSKLDSGDVLENVLLPSVENAGMKDDGKGEPRVYILSGQARAADGGWPQSVFPRALVKCEPDSGVLQIQFMDHDLETGDALVSGTWKLEGEFTPADTPAEATGVFPE